MKWKIFCICTMLIIYIPDMEKLLEANRISLVYLLNNSTQACITPMEALDLVKECYAANFIKIYYDGNPEAYYYKLPFADYYLVYEGKGGTEKEYLFHLYEFVLDEPETGIGHTVTYGWYTVNCNNRVITDQTQ